MSRILTGWGWLVVGAVVVLLILGLVLGLVNHNRRLAVDVAAARGGEAVAEGGREATAEALKMNAEAAAAARESETLTRRNDDEIRTAEGADAPVGPVADAGLRGLCWRAAYRDDPGCAGLR